MKEFFAPWSEGAATHLTHMVLPVLTLSAYYFGVFSIVYRAEYRDVAGRMFMRAARQYPRSSPVHS